MYRANSLQTEKLSLTYSYYSDYKNIISLKPVGLIIKMNTAHHS